MLLRNDSFVLVRSVKKVIDTRSWFYEKHSLVLREKGGENV